MVNELRVPVPEWFMERMRRADNAEKASQPVSRSLAKWWSACSPWCKEYNSAPPLGVIN